MIRIKEVIKEKGLTVAKVADLMGVQQTSLSRIINGGNTTVDMLEKIATALGVPITELFQSESSLYGVIMFNGKPYKIDSVAKLRELVGDVEPVVKF